MDSHALSIDKGYRQNKIKDLALIYQGGVHRIDWTSDQFNNVFFCIFEEL